MMADSEGQMSSAIAEFCSVTGADAQTARAFLQNHNGNVNEAADTYLASMDRGADAQDFDDDEEEEDEEGVTGASGPSQSAAARSVGGGPVHLPSKATGKASTASTSHKSQPKKKFGSLKDLQSDDAQDGPDDDDDRDQEYFAGGDKSGLAVKEPGTSSNARDPIQRLLETARRNGPPPPREEPARQSNFSGQGQTLGGDDTPSQVIPDANANARRPPQMVDRVLHLWQDGFSVDDGPLYRYDDPANARTLEMINRGAAPLDIMNVESGQAVDVKLEAHRNEKYVQPKKKFQAFSGSGHRLGSPAPEATSSVSSSPSAAAATAPTAAPSAGALPGSFPAAVHVDESQPIITLQIRLADGARLPSRFNASHTIGDVYAHVDHASSTGGRSYILATTFPTKELTDKTQTLGDMAEFKRGGVLVQKWS